MTKNKFVRFLANFKFAWSFAKLENKRSSTSLTAYEKASSFDLIQNRYFREIEDEKCYQLTLICIYNKYKDNPEKLKEEISDFISFWDECSDCTDAKVFDFKGEGDKIETEDYYER